MIVVDSFALLRPWWLLGLPVLALFYLLTTPAGDALAAWGRAADQTLLDAMAARGGTSGGSRTRSAVLLALALGLVALSGPAFRVHAQNQLRNLDATLIVMDVSNDATRGILLRSAALLGADIVERSGARQTGLIVYAGDAYLASQLSDDHGGIESLLFALDAQTVPDPGVRPERALSLAQNIAADAHIVQTDIVLISNGGGLEDGKARAMAQALHARGHHVHTIYLAGPGTPAVEQAPAIAALRDLAAAGGGMAGTAADPSPVFDAISNEAVVHLGNSVLATLEWRDLGRILLAFAAIPLLLGFRRARV